MSENEEIYLNQEFFLAHYIDDEGFYVGIKYRKVEQWAFYIRTIGAWYYPCEKDQKKLKELFLNAQLCLSKDSTKISLNQIVDEKTNKIHYTFSLPFITALPYYEFKPCNDCQKKIRQAIIESTTLTIGNKDYEHPVELSRKNEDDDKSYQTVEKHKATEKEQQAGSNWYKKQISESEYNKLAVIEE